MEHANDNLQYIDNALTKIDFGPDANFIITDPPYGYCNDELMVFNIREQWMIDRSNGFGLVFRPKAANDNRAASTGEVAQ